MPNKIISPENRLTILKWEILCSSLGYNPTINLFTPHLILRLCGSHVMFIIPQKENEEILITWYIFYSCEFKNDIEILLWLINLVIGFLCHCVRCAFLNPLCYVSTLPIWCEKEKKMTLKRKVWRHINSFF